MSTLIATPIVEEFPNFITGDDINPEATRYIFFPGDVIGTRRRQEMRDVTATGISAGNAPLKILQNGGHEVGSPCLLRTRGYIPRALITPLEVAAFWIPPELVPTGFPVFSGVTQTTPGEGAVRRSQNYLVGEKRYPGDAVSWILSSSQNEQGMRLGAVELTPLRGIDFKDVEASGLQRLFFPQYPVVPGKLDAIEKMILSVAVEDPDARMVRDQMLQACNEFREWGVAKIQIEHSLVKMGTLTDGWTYSYSDLARNLMDQLDITPQDQQFGALAKMQEEMARSTMQMMQQQAQGGNQTEVIAKLLENQAQIASTLAALTDKLSAPSFNLSAPAPKAKNGDNK